MNKAQPSYMSEWPDDTNPDGLYKFGSIQLELSLHEAKIERQTYSFLEWLGDIGGLFDALRYIGLFFVSPVARYYLKVELLTQNFRQVPKSKVIGEGEDTRDMASDMKHNLGGQEIIYKRNCLSQSLRCWRNDRYEKMLTRARN